MHLFNPDNDLALANFSINYTPPASARKIAADLAILPAWFAPGGATIITDNLLNEDFLLSVKKICPVDCLPVSFSGIGLLQDNHKIIPWGWNPALRKKLLGCGIREENLPSMEELKLLRQYAGRQNAVKMLRELNQLRDDFCGKSYFFENMTDLLNYLSKSKGDTVLKTPNSGSGKGLVWIKGKITDKQSDRCRRIIKEQGGIIAEPVLDKVQDFAMEFYMEKGKAVFSGYSLFKSAGSGAYAGNFLLPDEAIEKVLARYVFVETLRWVRSFYLQRLTGYFPEYNGYVGVDMMVCKTADHYRIQPCVEMNVRMNMGVVARIIYDRFVDPGSSGRFAIGFFKKEEKALEHHREMEHRFPLTTGDHKIKSGYLNLTPVSQGTSYVAYVLIEKNGEQSAARFVHRFSNLQNISGFNEFI